MFALNKRGERERPWGLPSVGNIPQRPICVPRHTWQGPFLQDDGPGDRACKWTSRVTSRRKKEGEMFAQRRRARCCQPCANRLYIGLTANPLISAGALTLRGGSSTSSVSRPSVDKAAAAATADAEVYLEGREKIGVRAVVKLQGLTDPFWLSSAGVVCNPQASQITSAALAV